MKNTPAAATASKALTLRYMQISSVVCVIYTSRYISSYNPANCANCKSQWQPKTTSMALRQQGTQGHAETPPASTTLACASARMSFVNVCAFETVLSKCHTHRRWESRGGCACPPTEHWTACFSAFHTCSNSRQERELTIV